MNIENENSNLLSQNPQVPQKPSTVPYRALFRYATLSDKFLIIVGVITSVLNGATQPLFAVIFGSMTNAFKSQDPDEILRDSGQSALYFVYLAVGTFVLSFLMFASLIISGEKQSIQLRKKYFQAILSQEVGWFDSINPNELNTKVADQTHDVQGAIQEKLGTFILAFATFIGSVVVGYSTGWQLALVITACMPVLALSVIIISATVMKSMQATQEGYSIAAAESEQALNAIKTVKMLDGEDFECQKYSSLLQKAARSSIKYSLINGAVMGMMFAFMIWTYALGFYYGAKLISDQTINDNNGKVYTAGDVMTIFFAIITGSFSLGQAGPCFRNFGKGKVAGAQIFQIIDRVPRIQSPANPKKLVDFDGEITLEEVEFTYPARPDAQVLKKTSLTIPAGKKVALVGESGCGKSTVLQLVERFYDVDAGAILIGKDKINIRDLDLNHYRSMVGLVGQEPVLFATSIRENLLYGMNGASEQEMIDALKKVNVWDSVSKMDKGLDTYVGIGGGQLSGGQKQRIAIARAILKRPKLLLLDEATSALDRTNEKLIQNTLDQVLQGITTIVIAHRLSTIQNSDIIYVFAEGKIVEYGTHNELMSLGGKYMALAKNQVSQNKDQYKGHHPSSEMNQNQIIVKELGSYKNEELLESVQSVNQFKPSNVIEKAANNINDLKILQKALTQADVTDKQSNDLTDVQVFARLFAYNRSERPYFALGLISAALNGCIFPCLSLFFSKIITILIRSNPILYENDSEKVAKQNEVYDEAILICFYFFLLGLGFLIFQACEFFLLSIVAENLSVKLRTDSFRKLLRMPIPYFDKPENNAATLTSRLAVDCKIVQALTSTIIGFKIQNMSSLCSGMAIAFSASWALTLIVLSMAPVTYLGRKMRTKLMGSFNERTDLAYRDSGNLIMEAVTNIRTVFSFGNQAIIYETYCRKVQAPIDECTKNGILAGLGFGFSQMQTYLINSFIFYMGALLVKYQGLELENMYRAIFGISFATIGGSRDAHFIGDADKGQAAARNIFRILDLTDEYQIESQTKGMMLTSQISGNIELKSIAFKYPGRDKNVFDEMSLVIPAGQKVSFVGASGCGKSTIMQMLMRFYDPDKGIILIDGVNIKEFSIRHLRRQFAVVSQEPTLFNATIAENIRYNYQNCSIEEIEEAAKKANAYHFIVNDISEVSEQRSNKGRGFAKKVGPKGQQISGGQKQRIAIARAILRNANVLLLDEATSALDSQAEELVQESLNNFMKEKTTLMIAHRISTIKESDIIYVFQGGKIVEQGKYDELVAQEQYFYRLEQGIAHERRQQSNTK